MSLEVLLSTAPLQRHAQACNAHLLRVSPERLPLRLQVRLMQTNIRNRKRRC